MRSRYLWSGAPLIARSLRSFQSSAIWHLRLKRVCASTEIDLSRWLEEKPFFYGISRAVLADRQTFGRGQHDRVWESPIGGVWLSAAIPFDIPIKSSGLFGLAVAVSVANTFQKSSVPVKLKWPNDLIVEKKKLAGFLPKIISRGKTVKYARVGIGINVRNKVAKNAISLSQILNQRNISISEWAAKTLVSLDEITVLLKDQNDLCRKAEKLLLNTKFYENDTNKTWDIKGLNNDGSLILRKGLESKSLYHWG